MSAVPEPVLSGRFVLAVGGRQPCAASVSSVVTVSADPLVVACPVSSSAAIHRMVQHQRRFAVSLPAPDCGPRRWRAGPHTGAPLLADSVAWLECRLTAICAEPSGPVLLGEVLGSFWSSCRDALAFAGLSAA